MVRHTTHILFFILLILPFTALAQEEILDSLAAKKNAQEIQNEQKELTFTSLFFDAIKHRAIGNYDKAIEALEKCQNIRVDDLAVIFELSKNYFAQEKYFEATIFAKKALEKDIDDPFLLEHLKNIYVRQKNYKEALEVQQQIVIQKPQNQADLIILYIRNNRIEDARQLLVDLEKRGMLSESLVPFKESLFPNRNGRKKSLDEPKQLEKKSLDELKISYAAKKTYATLQLILTKQFKANQFFDLEKDSKEGMELFPAQPFVYLMYGKALNKLKKYNEAIPYLKNGLDYVIDNINMEADFYEELSISYKGLRKNIDATKYANMALEKRSKKS